MRAGYHCHVRYRTITPAGHSDLRWWILVNLGTDLVERVSRAEEVPPSITLEDTVELYVKILRDHFDESAYNFENFRHSHHAYFKQVLRQWCADHLGRDTPIVAI